MAEGNGYKVGFFILFGIVFLALGAAGGWWYFNQQGPANKLPENPPPAIKTPAVLTEEPAPTAPPTQAIATVAPSVSDIEQIREAMAAKHSRPVADVHLTVSENSGTHARGGVKFGDDMAGGWFLAAKNGDNWVIVQDGNGTISCELVEPYDFPVSMVEECVDAGGNLIVR